MYKELIIGKKVALFDLDGTVIDSLPYWENAFYQVLNSVNATAEFSLPVRKGISVTEIWKGIFKEHDFLKKYKIEDLVQRTYHEYLTAIIPSEANARGGFWDLAFELKLNKNFKLGLTSNSNREVVDKLLEKMEMTELFEVTIAGNEVNNLKPNPEMYNTAAKKLGVRSKEVLVFEDSIMGAQAAKAASMDMIIIWDGTFKQTDYPRGVLSFFPDFSPLPRNLDLTMDEVIQQIRSQP